MALNPASVEDANLLLARLGAQPRLLRHVALVGEAGERLLELAGALHLPIDPALVRVGIVLHDAGKILVSAELDAPGREHEPRGQDLLALPRSIAYPKVTRLEAISRTQHRTLRRSSYRAGARYRTWSSLTTSLSPASSSSR